MFDFLKYFLNPSTIALLLGGILTSLFGFLAAISKEERTPKWIAWGAFLAGLLVLFAGVLSGYQQDITSKLIQNRTEKIANLSQENAKFAKINAKLNKKIADSITGGDGFCYYQVGFPYGTKNKLSGFLMHVGEYPLYDLTIRITDSYKKRKIYKKYDPPILFDKIRETEEIIRMDTYFGAGQANYFDSLIFWDLPPDRDKQSLSIHFTARNGDWHQQISLRRVEEKWKFATRVTRIIKNKGRVNLIPERILDGYPQNDQGEFEW